MYSSGQVFCNLLDFTVESLAPYLCIGTFFSARLIAMNQTNITAPYVLTNENLGLISQQAFNRTVIVGTALVLLVLCFVFRNQQPLKSRRVVPFIFLIFKAVSGYIYLPDAFPYAYFGTPTSPLYQAMCFVKHWTASPFTNLIFIIFNIAYAQYFLIRLNNARKEARMESIKQANKHGFDFLKVVNILLRDTSVVIALVLLLILFYAVGAIDLAIQGGVCQLAGFFFYFNLAVVLFFAITLLLMFCVDIIYTGYCGLCGTKKFFQKVFYDDDPLVYRLELLFIIIWLAISALQLIIVLMLGIMTVRVPSTVPTWVLQSTSIFIEMFGYMAVPGVVLFYTIKWNRRAKRQVQPDRLSISLSVCNPCGAMVQLILEEDVELANLFKKFTEKEFSVENVLAYRDIKAYQQIQDPNERVKAATAIIDSYLSSTSPIEVNVSSELVRGVAKEFAQLKTSPDYELPSTLFDRLLDEGIVVNLIDTYARFFNWEEFRSHMAAVSKGALKSPRGTK
jgi:hypothetical protein